MLDHWISFTETNHIAILVMSVSIGIVFSCLAWVIIKFCCKYYTLVRNEPFTEITHSDHAFIKSTLRRSRNLAIRRPRYSHQTRKPLDFSLKPSTKKSGTDEAISQDNVMNNDGINVII